jgi:hypothetical protein
MAEDDWEIIPHKVIAELRDEVGLLKERLEHPDATAKDVLTSMVELKGHIVQLSAIFKSALEETKTDTGIDKTHQMLMARLDELSMQHRELLEQNKQIARAMVAIADMVEGGDRSKPMPTPPPKHVWSKPAPRAIPPPPPTQPFGKQDMQTVEDFMKPTPSRHAAPPAPPREMAPPSRGMPPPPSGSMPPPPPAFGAPPEHKGLFGKIFKK